MREVSGTKAMPSPLLSLLLLLLLFIGPIAATAAAHRRPPPIHVPTADDRLIFVLAGQSNMAGRGGVSGNHWDGVVPPECRPSPSVFRLSAELHWEEAREPLHADIDVRKTCGVGPGMAFALALRSSSSAPPPTTSVGLVPCAVGGTKIEEWEKGRELYESMVRRTKAAALISGGGRVAAVLWYQGESDTVYLRDAEAYGMRMERLIRDLRFDLGLPDLPFITVAIASGEGRYIEEVRNAQKGLNVANVTCVDAKGLQLGADHLHLTTSAQVRLGKMLAAAYSSHATDKIDHQIESN